MILLPRSVKERKIKTRGCWIPDCPQKLTASINGVFFCRTHYLERKRNPKGSLDITQVRHTHNYGVSLHGRFNRARQKAKTRALQWRIAFKEYSLLVKAPCFYCGCAVDGAKGIGLDRVNSGIGYTTKNVVPSCWTCNDMKGGMAFQDFSLQIRRIAFNTFLK